VVSSSTRSVALAGRVPVKVNLDGGAIAIGDPIALSSVPGVGARATTPEETIGVALSPYDGTGSSTIDVFVRPGLASPKSAGGISGFLGSIFSQITAWLGNAGNGITNIFAQTITATNVTADNITAHNSLCVGSTCVTPAQFQAMVAAAGQSPSPAPPTAPSAPTTISSSTSLISDAATSTAAATTEAPSIVPDYTASTTLPASSEATTSPTVQEATTSAAALSPN
jgi:hypothetical protein